MKYFQDYPIYSHDIPQNIPKIFHKIFPTYSQNIPKIFPKNVLPNLTVIKPIVHCAALAKMV
jgi:hypothetical protein